MDNLVLQKGIELLLRTDQDLPPIYDGVRPSARYPYITLGREKVFYENEQTRHESTIFIYSQSFSILEVKKVLTRLVALLEANPLRVENAAVALNRVRSSESLRLADGKTYRGELTLETILEPQ